MANKSTKTVVANHVAFGAGEYQPGAMMGDALIAHELAHTIQQNEPGSGISNMQTGILTIMHL